MKKQLLTIGMTVLLVMSCGMSFVHAQDACTTISNANYDQCCSGVASNDSVACNNYANNDSGAATAAQCANITSYVIYSDCCSGVPSNDSTACNAYNNDNGGQPGTTLTKGGTIINTPTAGPALSATGTAASVQNTPLNIHLNNPLKVNNITDAIALFMSIIVRIALPLIVLFFIWSGFTFILARGKPEEIKKAKAMFFYTVIGTLLILGAWVITNAIIGTVNVIMS